MAKYTKDDILRIVKDEDVEFIRMQFTDIFGMMKNVAITSSQIEKALNNQIAIDGSSIEGFTRIHESDQYLHPDLDTFVILPWRPQHGKVARFICDVYNPDGTPFVGDPRGILKRTLKRAEAMGFDAFNTLIDRYQPRYFIHGHVHMNYGLEFPRRCSRGETQVINAYETYTFEY